MIAPLAHASYRTPNERAFDSIYKHRTWGGDGTTTSLSGSGSSLTESKNLCTLLVSWVALAVRKQEAELSFLDAGMGDWFWMAECLPKMVRALPQGDRL